MNFEPRYHRKKHTIYRKWARGFDYFHHTQNRSGKSIRPPYVSLPVGAPGLSPSRVTEHEVDLSDKQIKNRNKRAAYKNRKRIGKRAKWADVRKNTYDLSRRNLYYHRNNRSINARRAHRRRSWRQYKSERLAQRAKQESKKLFKIHPSMHKRKIWARVRNRIKVQAAVHKWYHHRKKHIRGDFDVWIRDQDWFEKHWAPNCSPYKLKANKKLRIGCINIRNMAKLTKQQQIERHMKAENLDILMISETNRNTSDMHRWDGYTVFYSTSIDPKVREQEEKRRENLPKGKRKGKGKGIPPHDPFAYKSDPDYEKAGVGIVINNKLLRYLKDVKQTSGRSMHITLQAAGGDINFVSNYAPHAGYNLEDKEIFYETLSETLNGIRGKFYIGGDFNARIYHVRDIDTEAIGPHIICRDEPYLATMAEGTRDSRNLFISFLKTQELIALNTVFDKPPDKLVTYQEKQRLMRIIQSIEKMDLHLITPNMLNWTTC